MRHASCLKIGGILFASLLLGLGNVWLNPHRPAWCEDALAEGEVRLVDAHSWGAQILWVDARSSEDYAAGKILGAILLNEDKWDDQLPVFLAAWKPQMRVVVYCNSQKCHASHEIAERLRTEVGMTDVYVLKGGWEAWLSQKK